MKTEDFERLKDVCEKEGFVVSTGGVMPGSSILVEVYKKDPWDGVEFVENLDQHLTGGKKYFKVNWIDNETNLIHVDCGYFTKIGCKPSNEQAYVEQLKKEAFERLGEIKEGDRFDTGYGIHSIIENHPEWFYNKHIDFLYYKGLIVYSKGKWAERVKERVKVLFDGGNIQSRHFYFLYDKEADNKMAEIGCFRVGQFLAYQLEKYLNGQIGEILTSKENFPIIKYYEK